MTSDFFYSKSTKLYVARKPLKINSRTKKASEINNVEMTWDDEGRINFIDFDNSLKLLDALNAQMMTPIEYWEILRDAEEEGDEDMIQSLQSNEFCEWLSRVYISDGYHIDNPKVISQYSYSGKKTKSKYLEGRPGWFSPEENIDYKLGLPLNIDLFRDKFQNSWKYWSPEFSVTELNALAPIRGYVTSVGKPSFDLGIPVDSRQPVQMLRECRKKPLQLPISIDVLKKADKVLSPYKSVSTDLKNESKYKQLYENKSEATPSG